MPELRKELKEEDLEKASGGEWINGKDYSYCGNTDEYCPDCGTVKTFEILRSRVDELHRCITCGYTH